MVVVENEDLRREIKSLVLESKTDGRMSSPFQLRGYKRSRESFTSRSGDLRIEKSPYFRCGAVGGAGTRTQQDPLVSMRYPRHSDHSAQEGATAMESMMTCAEAERDAPKVSVALQELRVDLH